MILISVDSLTRVGATRRFQFISYWLTGRRMEVRIVQINGVKGVGMAEWVNWRAAVASRVLQIEFEMCVLNGSPPTNQP